LKHATHGFAPAPGNVCWDDNAACSIIKKVLNDDNRKEKSIKEVSDSSFLGMFYLDAVIDTERLIKDAQKRMWKALKLEPKFNIPLEQTQEILEKFSDSKIILAILHVDLVGSTKLSMTLPTEKLATIVQAFTQEMSLLVSVYGGHIFKYVGDAILAFFFVSDNNLYLPCSNAVNCARTMIRVMQDGINPILNEYDYPEMGVRVGIDIGENVVVGVLTRIQLSQRHLAMKLIIIITKMLDTVLITRKT
jgi:adenylate cyclase